MNGVMIYVDPMGETLGYEDVFTKIDMCKRHMKLSVWALITFSVIFVRFRKLCGF